MKQLKYVLYYSIRYISMYTHNIKFSICLGIDKLDLLDRINVFEIDNLPDTT